MAIALIPIRRAVLMIRQAISPRLAMRTFANMAGLLEPPVYRSRIGMARPGRRASPAAKSLAERLGGSSSKYPPAKPGALEFGAAQSGPLPTPWPSNLRIHTIRCAPHHVIRTALNPSGTNGRAPERCSPPRERHASAHTAGNVKLLLPPRQSRGISSGL